MVKLLLKSSLIKPAGESLAVLILKIRDMKNVKEIIEALRDVDGETMQHILEEVGMELQMLRQLIMSAQTYQVDDILEEKRILSNQGKLI